MVNIWVPKLYLPLNSLVILDKVLNVCASFLCGSRRIQLTKYFMLERKDIARLRR